MITKTHAKNIQARVKRGAKWLDKHEPGWEKKVNPKLLNMSAGTACILGQVYGDHDNADDWTNGYDIGSGIIELDKAGRSLPNGFRNIPSYYGFDESAMEDDLYGDSMSEFWSILAEEWVAAAKERLAYGNLG
jgi:hypothetical protein